MRRGGAWRSAEFRVRLENTVVTSPEEPWHKEVPVYPREGALNGLWAAQKAVLSNMDAGNIKTFILRFLYLDR